MKNYDTGKNFRKLRLQLGLHIFSAFLHNFPDIPDKRIFPDISLTSWFLLATRFISTFLHILIFYFTFLLYFTVLFFYFTFLLFHFTFLLLYFICFYFIFRCCSLLFVLLSTWNGRHFLTVKFFFFRCIATFRSVDISEIWSVIQERKTRWEEEVYSFSC